MKVGKTFLGTSMAAIPSSFPSLATSLRFAFEYGRYSSNEGVASVNISYQMISYCAGFSWFRTLL